MSKNHSDFWRNPYLQEQDSQNNLSQKKILSDCLADISRIASSFDSSVNVVFNDDGSKNILSDNTIVLNAKIGLKSDLSTGKKVDVYAGEVILGAALRNRPEEVKNLCITHTNRARDINLSDLDRSASMLYLAMEIDATCSLIQEKTPGFISYIQSRVKEYQTISSQELQESFNSGPEDSHKFMAIFREFDTFNSCPLNYGSFNKAVGAIINQVRNITDPNVRLAAAYQIAQKYLVGIEDQPNILSDINQLMTSGEVLGLDSVQDMNLDIPSSGDDQDGNEDDDSDSQDDSESNNPGSILKAKEKFKKIKTNLVTDNLGNDLVGNDKKALSIYQHDCQQVLDLSEAINEALQILNHQQKVWDQYSLRQGELDEGALYKLSDNSDNVFYQNETLPKTNIQLGFLIDESGSMSTKSYSKNPNEKGAISRSIIARRLVTAFVEGTKDISGLDLQIYGHAAPDGVCNVYKYFDSTVNKEDTFKVGYSSHRLYNYDGFAIQRASQDMIEHQKDYNRRIMIVLSDGEPSVSLYSGNEAKEHISEAVREANRLGIETYMIGIDKAFSEQDALYLYGNGKYIILPDCDLNNMSMIISAFLQDIANS